VVSGARDAGLFGPESETWRVVGERSVLLGGMRALLMQAAHPLVAAAGRQTRMYQHDPWGRLERTLRLTLTILFGSKAEVSAAAWQINVAHRQVSGVDPITNLPYRAQDPDLLLWVHASLVSSFLLFERLTIGRLDDRGRQRFHEEAMVLTALLGLPRRRVPPTVAALDSYIQHVCQAGILQATEESRAMLALIRTPSEAGTLRSQLASFAAVHTLPPAIRDLYGEHHGRVDQTKLALLCAGMRTGRLLVPREHRLIEPARAALARMRGTGPFVPVSAVPVLPAARRTCRQD
jgi:uncharacterized protein (DUF2236 family)